MLPKGNKALFLEEIRDLVTVPSFKVFSILNDFNIDCLNGDFFAVRSSSSDEDNFKKTNAGCFETFLFVKREDVFYKVSYLLNKGISAIVQEMIEPDFSGVCFTNSERFTEVYYVADGLCEAITNGEINTVNYYRNNNSLLVKDYHPKFKKIFDGTVIKNIPVDNYSFSEQSIRNIFSVIDKLSLKYNFALDIEFSVKNNICYILQVRQRLE